MIEQTELVVSKWDYHHPQDFMDDDDKLTSDVSLAVMRKRTAIKKGIACRFTCKFMYAEEMILEYVAGDTYVIDLADKINREELQTMIRNSYTKFKEKFDFRKLGTVLQNKSLVPFNEKMYDLEPVLLLLV